MSPERNQEIPKIETAPNFAILNPIEFLDDFRKEAELAFERSAVIRNPGHKNKKMWLQAMVVEYGHAPGVLLKLLEKAAKFGFDARLHLDDYSKHVSVGISNYKPTGPSYDRPLFRAINQEHLEQLRQDGVRITITNPQQTLREKVAFWKGRNHKKIAIITTPHERQVAWIGGLNFYDGNFSRIDYMVKIDDPITVTAIIDAFPRINENRRKEDTEIKCTDDTTLLIDCGNPHDSIILSRAIQKIKEANKRIICVSYLFPEGGFQQALNSAHDKGIMVTFIGSDPAKESFELKIKRTFDKATRRKKDIRFTMLYPQKQFVHAKLLIADSTVIVGSNNFSPFTVGNGTEEIALVSTNSILLRNALCFVNNLLVQENIGVLQKN